MKDIELIYAFEALLDKKQKESNDLFYNAAEELQGNIITLDEFKLITEQNQDMSKNTYLVKMKITEIFKNEINNEVVKHENI